MRPMTCHGSVFALYQENQPPQKQNRVAPTLLVGPSDLDLVWIRCAPSSVDAFATATISVRHDQTATSTLPRTTHACIMSPSMDNYWTQAVSMDSLILFVWGMRMT